MVGMFGSRSAYRERDQTAGLDVFDYRRQRIEHDLNLAAEQIGLRGRRAAIRYVKYANTSHHLEQLARQMAQVPIAGRCHIELARVGLGIGDEFGNRLRRNRWIYHHHNGHVNHARDRRDIEGEIVLERFVERRVDGIRRREVEQRVAGRHVGHGFGCDVAGGARAASTRNCWPSFSDRDWATRRATMSDALPAAWPTMIFTGRDG